MIQMEGVAFKDAGFPRFTFAQDSTPMIAFLSPLSVTTGDWVDYGGHLGGSSHDQIALSFGQVLCNGNNFLVANQPRDHKMVLP